MPPTKKTILPPYLPTQEQRPQWQEYLKLKEQHDREFAIRGRTDAKISELVKMSQSWGQSDSIRVYVAAVMARIYQGSDPAILAIAEAWAAWALGVADTLDPVALQIKEFSTHLKTKDPAD